MSELEPPRKSNRTEILQIKFRNSRSMRPMNPDYPGRIPGTNLVRVETHLPVQAEIVEAPKRKSE